MQKTFSKKNIILIFVCVFILLGVIIFAGYQKLQQFKIAQNTPSQSVIDAANVNLTDEQRIEIMTQASNAPRAGLPDAEAKARELEIIKKISQ